jgi:hypothetical protein
VNAVGGTHVVYFAYGINGQEGQAPQKRLRIYVAPEALFPLVGTLLQMEGWKDMTISGKEEYSDLLARLIIHAGGREISSA